MATERFTQVDMSLMGMCSWDAVSSLRGLVRRGIWTLDACFRAFFVSVRGGTGRFATLGARGLGLDRVRLLSILWVDEGERARAWFGYCLDNVRLELTPKFEGLHTGLFGATKD